MLDTDLAWAAGIIDGEGAIVISNQRSNGHRVGLWWHVGVRVGNTDPRMTIRLRDLFGGCISGPRIGRLGTRPSWEWCLSGGAIVKPLTDMLPYFVVKRGQAELALAYATTLQRSGHRLPAAVVDKRINLHEQLRVLRQREAS